MSVKIPANIQEFVKGKPGWVATASADGMPNVAIKGSLRKGDVVTLVGFGSFFVGRRTARQGRNPRTGATIKIRAAKVPKFRAGKALKDAVN